MENNSSESDQISSAKLERAFLHDIATPIAILSLVLRKVKDNVNKIPQDHIDPKTVELLERAERSLEKLEELHANHKLVISEREKLQNSA